MVNALYYMDEQFTGKLAKLMPAPAPIPAS